jgi:CheY-like chemotaxis protein/nitrogen-specific signal transduction histidine kinase
LEHTFDPLTKLSEELAAKNQELITTNRLKSQFMANMSHELRTPLNSIIGYTDLIINKVYGDITEKQLDRLEKVARNGRHLLGLINDILDLSRIEAGRMALTPETVDTVQLLNEVVSVVEPQIVAKNLSLSCDYTGTPPIFADRRRAQQILANILNNAAKFTHEGHIRISAQGQGTVVQFEIEDTGIGIPRDKQHLVFEEFRQVDSTSTRQYGGSGLGMPITRRLVELSGGTIWFKSTPDVGTTFFITLPQATRDGHRTIDATRTPVAQSMVPCVLIIDDSLDSQMLLRDTILAARPDYQVFIANSGREGLRRAQELQPDLITLDVMMPSMDGWQVLQTLKDDPILATIPVILVSVIDNHELAYQMGAVAIIEKPIDPNQLLTVLDRVVTTIN